MDTGFLIVVAISLCFLSAMIVARMAAGGAPARRIALPVVELWLAFILWIAVFRSLSAAIGAPIGGGESGEASGLFSRFAALEWSTRIWAAAGVVASVAIAAHLLWSLRRTMSGSIRP